MSANSPPSSSQLPADVGPDCTSISGGLPPRAYVFRFPPMSSCLLPQMSANPPPSRPFPSIILPADQPVKLFGQLKTPRWGRAICSFYRCRCGSMRNRPCREIRRPALGRPPGRRRGENTQLLPVSMRFNAGSTPSVAPPRSVDPLVDRACRRKPFWSADPRSTLVAHCHCG